MPNAPTCQVPGCTGPSVARGLCDKHRQRLKKNGHLEQTRPSDWGAREKHPLYDAWSWHKRRNTAAWPERWRSFWLFVEDVKERPSKDHTLRRINPDAPWENNWEWREKAFSSKTKDQKAYFAEYQRHYRKAHPWRAKHSSLMKQYGIGLAEYKAMYEAQKGVCAICGLPETMQIRGKTLELAVDHNHETGKIRALLCSPCNKSIGAMRESPALLRKAADYLESHN